MVGRATQAEDEHRALVVADVLRVLSWLNISLNMANVWSEQTAWKLMGAPVAATAASR
jgi:hypothetical protein